MPRSKSALIGLVLSGVPSGTQAPPATDNSQEVSTEELGAILENRTATVLDARPALEFAISHIPGALNVAPKPGVPASMYVSDVAEIGRLVQDKKAASRMLDSRSLRGSAMLPMEDHNTRIIVLGADAAAARYVAEALTREAFHNVSYFPGGTDLVLRQVGRK